MKKYGLNDINIDSTGGCWTVDISENGHGTVPEVWVNVTQTTSGHFTVQTAVKCNKDANGARAGGAVWVRDKYTGGSGGAWSSWTKVANKVDIEKLEASTNSLVVLIDKMQMANSEQFKSIKSRLEALEKKH